MSNEHIPYTRVVENLARRGWGQQFKSLDEAQKKLLSKPEELAGYAMLELLRRLDALSDSSGRNEANSRLVRPSNAVPFPHLSVGDWLYSGDMECGICRHLIVGKDDDGYVVTVFADWIPESDSVHVSYATESYFDSKDKAILASAKLEVEYSSPRVAFSKRAIAAVNDGKPLDEFEAGYGDGS